MSSVIVLSLLGCILQPSVSEKYIVGENRYCVNYHQHLQPPQQKSGSECEAACDNDTSCAGYIMSCGLDCYLMANCTDTVVSSCNSYVAAKNTTESNLLEFQKDPWKSDRFYYAFLILCLSCPISAGVFAKCLQLEFDELPFNPRVPRAPSKIARQDTMHSDLEKDNTNLTTEISNSRQPRSPFKIARNDTLSGDLWKDNTSLATEISNSRQPRSPFKIARNDTLSGDLWKDDTHLIAEFSDDPQPQDCLGTLVTMFAKDDDLYTVADSIQGSYFFQWRFRFIAFLVVVVVAIFPLPLGMINFPKDGNHVRGVCGLVHHDLSEYNWDNFFAMNHDRNLLVNGSRYPDPAFGALPHQCQQVYSTDVVDHINGPRCKEWCTQIAGDWFFHFICSSPTYGIGHIYMVCNKVFVWDKVKWIPKWAGLVIALLYGCVSRIYAEYVHRMAKQRNSAEHLQVDKPRTDTCTVSRKNLKPPLCFITADSDASILIVQTWVAVAGFVVDPIGDLNGCISFLLSGEFVYAAGLMLVALIPNLHNLLQSEGTAACLLSLERGFPTRRVYVLQVREGSFEGIYSLVMAVFILMRGAYFHSFGNWWHLLSIFFVAATSVISSLPHAGAASLLIQSRLNFDDYTEVEETMFKQHWMKFLPVFDGVALAVAFGRSFSNLRLALFLWLIGAFIGVIGSITRAAFSPRSSISLQVVFAFMVWPLSPVRLAVDPKFWKKIVKGNAELAFIGSRGCASLPPKAFYVHRWLTLINFWIFTAFRPDGEVYFDTLGIFWHMDTPSSFYYYKSLLAGIFILGWLGLPVSMLCFWYWRADLEEAYMQTLIDTKMYQALKSNPTLLALTTTTSQPTNTQQWHVLQHMAKGRVEVQSFESIGDALKYYNDLDYRHASMVTDSSFAKIKYYGLPRVSIMDDFRQRLEQLEAD